MRTDYELALQEQIEYLSEGIDYRYETAKLAYEVFKLTEDINLYESRNNTYSKVDDLINEAKIYYSAKVSIDVGKEVKFRKQDIAKMLNTLYVILKNKTNQTIDTREGLELKRKNREIKFILSRH